MDMLQYHAKSNISAINLQLKKDFVKTVPHEVMRKKGQGPLSQSKERTDVANTLFEIAW